MCIRTVYTFFFMGSGYIILAVRKREREREKGGVNFIVWSRLCNDLNFSLDVMSIIPSSHSNQQMNERKGEKVGEIREFLSSLLRAGERPRVMTILIRKWVPVSLCVCVCMEDPSGGRI